MYIFIWIETQQQRAIRALEWEERKEWVQVAATRTFITLHTSTGEKKLKALKYIVLFLDSVKTVPHEFRTTRMPFSSRVLPCLCFDLHTKQNKCLLAMHPISTQYNEMVPVTDVLGWVRKQFLLFLQCSIVRASLSSLLRLNAGASYFYDDAVIAVWDSHIYFSFGS